MSFSEKLIKQKIMLNEIIHPEKANINFLPQRQGLFLKILRVEREYFETRSEPSGRERRDKYIK